MSLSQIRLELNSVLIKSGRTKLDKPYFYIEVLEPVRRFITPQSTAAMVVLQDLADKAVAANLNVLVLNNGFVCDSQSFSKST